MLFLSLDPCQAVYSSGRHFTSCEVNTCVTTQDLGGLRACLANKFITIGGSLIASETILIPKTEPALLPLC